MRFQDREEAGKLLAQVVRKLDINPEESLILAIPRGGVPVAYEVSKATGIPFSLIVTKKLTPPSDPEAAFGAITTDGTFLVDREFMRYMGVSESDLEMIREKTLKEAIEKEKKYISKKPDVKGKTTIVIDDGIATGYTAMVAGKWLRDKGAYRVILAVPVCPTDSYTKAHEYFDQVVCYYRVDSLFFAVGAYYQDFHQVEDEELLNIIQKAKEEGLYL